VEYDLAGLSKPETVSRLDSNFADTPDTPDTPDTLDTLDTVSRLDSNLSHIESLLKTDSGILLTTNIMGRQNHGK
jgi:hypothetical protein